MEKQDGCEEYKEENGRCGTRVESRRIPAGELGVES